MPARKVSKSHLTGQAMMQALNKRYGAGTIGFASDPSLAITRIPSGIMSLDYILNGGWARGRHAELYGPFGVGKTLISLVSIATAQDMGLKCAFMDAEKTFDPAHSEHLGVNLKSLAFPLRKQRLDGESIISIMESLLYSDEYDVMVLDSIAALLPQAEKEKAIEEGNFGTYQARLMSRALRKLTTANNKTVLIYINQMRDAVGKMFTPSVTSGGRAMGFYAGTRLEISKAHDIKESRITFDSRTLKDQKKEVRTGHRILLRITKDKTGAQAYDEASFVYDYQTASVDRLEDLIYLGRRLRLIKAAGDPEQLWLVSNPSKKFKGRKVLKTFLKGNPTVAAELEESILEGSEDDD